MHLLQRVSHCTRLWVVVILASVGVPPRALASGVVGGGTEGSCTEAALNAALTGGGVVTFNCGAAPVTITVTSTKFISNDTTIDGANSITLDGDHNVRVLQVYLATSLNLKNIAIINGMAADGGGIVNVGTITLTNTTLSGNLASNRGGGIYNTTGGTVGLINSTLSGNSARFGGAIDNQNGTVTLTNSTVAGNSASISGVGGAIYNSGTLSVSNSTLSRNMGAATGGGIENNTGGATVSNSTLSDNAAEYGGAIHNQNGTLTLTDSALTGNTAAQYGGAFATSATSR